jgi:hypothetical protein
MNEQEIRIVKIESSPSLSGRSRLTYQIGCNAEKIVYIRLFENTGQGIFNKDWVPLSLLDPLLSSQEKQITSGMLRSLFKGKSVNSAGFIIAALISEGLIKISDESLRSYECIDPAEFNMSIQILLDSDMSMPLPTNQKKTAVVKEEKKITKKSELQNPLEQS